MSNILDTYICVYIYISLVSLSRGKEDKHSAHCCAVISPLLLTAGVSLFFVSASGLPPLLEMALMRVERIDTTAERKAKTLN